MSEARRQGEAGAPSRFRRVTIIVPARNESASLPRLALALESQASEETELEVVVVDDGSTDETADTARSVGFKVLPTGAEGDRGNPARARNLGVRGSSGDPIVFLDADCVPKEGWLKALLDRHAGGETTVGGSLDLPSGLHWTARADYYCGWYHVHSRRPGGIVPNHPPGNLSVRRKALETSSGFTEEGAAAYAHEELAWQAELQQAGQQIYFEPGAVSLHFNRKGLGNLLRRNYRWGYSSIESKAKTGAARLPWLYRYPLGLIALAAPLALAQTIYIEACWIRAKRFEPMFMLPVVLVARIAYCTGMMVGGWRWLRRSTSTEVTPRPLWE